ncbi:DUF6122 family protein [Flagellimonas sp. HMM57]|uniref:DUF6122 family protein n=1 Tax=unclassified Flagellimonas TaxID=2644544 RepID=UPI001F0A4D0B|nr:MULTISPECIES: DUF6122 family protein [unclassified Flagellimonas]UII75283.1 DUF6122 family protein [Flagellimonas sp. HMM57]
MFRFFIHYGIHFLAPILIGLLLVKENKLKVTLILLAGILIDIDHAFAEPIFDANRCSIGFHPLHSIWAILLYCVLPFFKKTRLIGLALIIHIIADSMDCLLM